MKSVSASSHFIIWPGSQLFIQTLTITGHRMLLCSRGMKVGTDKLKRGDVTKLQRLPNANPYFPFGNTSKYWEACPSCPCSSLCPWFWVFGGFPFMSFLTSSLLSVSLVGMIFLSPDDHIQSQKCFTNWWELQLCDAALALSWDTWPLPCPEASFGWCFNSLLLSKSLLHKSWWRDLIGATTYLCRLPDDVGLNR